MTTIKKKGFLGIDNGTQGLTVLLVDDEELQVVATGEASYNFVPNLPEGCYEQVASDWEDALQSAMDQIKIQMQLLQEDYDILGIGLSGQMHGQVLVNEAGQTIGNVRLWCDARNQEQADELNELFSTAGDDIPEIPKRCTIARWLWTIRNQPELAKQTKFLTTPAGWLSFKLTNSKTLGIGDASGMFPMNSTTCNYHTQLFPKFDGLVDGDGKNIPSIASILPKVVVCGQDAGVVSQEAADWLGIPAGIPVAAAEGDQPAALAGSLIGRSGMVSCSFGTSVCANLVGDNSNDNDKNKQNSMLDSSPNTLRTSSTTATASTTATSKLINHFSNPNGQPIYMVWLRNGTTFFNAMVESYSGGDHDAFATIMPQVLAAPPDCGGLLALPFMDDEPGLQVHQGGTACIIGWNPSNNTPGNACKAALLSTMFNLKQGILFLQDSNVTTKELILTGGLTKTPECGQILADVFDLPVRLLQGSADEGCSWGAAVLAKYRYYCLSCDTSPSSVEKERMNWPDFLDALPAQPTQTFQPNPETVPIYQTMYERYQRLLALQPELQKAVQIL